MYIWLSFNFKLNVFFIFLCYNKNQRGGGLGQTHAELEKASDRTNADSSGLLKADIEDASPSLAFSFFNTLRRPIWNFQEQKIQKNG